MLYSLFFDFSRSLLSVADFSPRQLLHFCYYCRRTSRDTRSYNRPIKYSIRRLSLPAPDILTVHFFAHHQPCCWTFLLSTFLASIDSRAETMRLGMLALPSTYFEVCWDNSALWSLLLPFSYDIQGQSTLPYLLLRSTWIDCEPSTWHHLSTRMRT